MRTSSSSDQIFCPQQETVQCVGSHCAQLHQNFHYRAMGDTLPSIPWLVRQSRVCFFNKNWHFQLYTRSTCLLATPPLPAMTQSLHKRSSRVSEQTTNFDLQTNEQSTSHLHLPVPHATDTPPQVTSRYSRHRRRCSKLVCHVPMPWREKK